MIFLQGAKGFYHQVFYFSFNILIFYSAKLNSQFSAEPSIYYPWPKKLANNTESTTNSITPCLLLQFPKHRMSITSAASTAVSTGSTSGGTTSVGGGVGVNSVAATADHRPPFIQNSVRAATSPGLINDDSSTAVSRWL